jgi:hypothetical protein
LRWPPNASPAALERRTAARGERRTGERMQDPSELEQERGGGGAREEGGEPTSQPANGEVERRATQAGPPTGAAGGIASFLEERYLSIDRRLLGLFRIYFGSLLLVDVLRRVPYATVFYSNEGVLSNHYSLFAPLGRPYFSLFTALSSPTEVKVGMAATALVYCLYIVGYRTRLAQILALVLYTSLNARNLFLENGGCVTVAILCAWTVFLPLGDRFSVDAVLRGLRARRDGAASALNDRTAIAPLPDRHVTLVALGIAVQIAAVYFFNTVHKDGATWRSGEAVHWVLWQNRIATVWAGWLRMHEPSWLSPALSYGTLVIEGAAPVLVLSPFGQRYLRTAHVVATWALHIGIALLVSVGPFSYAMLALNLLVLPPAVLDAASRALGRRAAEVEIAYDEREGRWHRLARLLSRLDTLGKIRFTSGTSGGLPKGASFGARIAGKGKWKTGKAALALAGGALPLGAFWSRVLPVGALRAALDAWLLRVDPAGAVLVRRAEGVPFEATPSPPSLLERLGVRPGWVREGAAAVLFVAVLVQITNDNRWVPARFKIAQPAVLQPVIQYPRLLQGWTMFAPEAPRDDGLVVVDATTADGRHIDPFTGAAPDFDAPLHGPWYHGQFICDYFLKIHFDGNKGYRDELRKYLLNWQRLEHRPAADRLVAFEVYWVSNAAPPPGSTTPTGIERTLLLEQRAERGQAAVSSVGLR